MNPYKLTLISKKQLTHDVYELTYSLATPLDIKPGQFLLCDCDTSNPRLKRSYSVSWSEGNSISFIIKRLIDGGGGSKAICDQELGHMMHAWGPMGHFILRENSFPKVFIGTGTGFAPLYFMVKSQIQNTKYKTQNGGIFLLFGVRELGDVFYTEELAHWSQLSVFDYEIFCSRESCPLPEKHHPGRITEYLTPERVMEFNNSNETEFYICGSPAMVTEVRAILESQGVSPEKVFFEQY